MILRFDTLYFDEANDRPVAVCRNRLHRPFLFELSCKTAEDILNVLNKKGSPLLSSLFIDLVRYGGAKILKISITENRNDNYMGVLRLKIKDKVKRYHLNCDELILLSVMFKKSIAVNPALFLELPEHSPEYSYEEDELFSVDLKRLTN